MPPQGRLGDRAQAPVDAHGCPACPHPTIGPAIAGSPDVSCNGRPALRVDDPGLHMACCGPNTWTAKLGSMTVFINGKSAYRMTDTSQHCGGVGQLIEGSPNCEVGGPMGTASGGAAGGGPGGSGGGPGGGQGGSGGGPGGGQGGGGGGPGGGGGGGGGPGGGGGGGPGGGGDPGGGGGGPGGGGAPGGGGPGGGGPGGGPGGGGGGAPGGGGGPGGNEHPAFGSVTVSVSDERDLPAGDVQIQLAGPTPATATTDFGGNVRLPDLLPGAYQLTAKKPDHDDTLLEVSVEAGGASEVGIVLLTPLDWSQHVFDLAVEQEGDPDAPAPPQPQVAHVSDEATPGGTQHG